MEEVLTVQVAVPDALDVFGVNKVVASLPYNVYRGQVHIITNPTKSRTHIGIQKRENIETLKRLRDKSEHFHYTRVPVRTWYCEGKPFIDKIISLMYNRLSQK